MNLFGGNKSSFSDNSATGRIQIGRIKTSTTNNNHNNKGNNSFLFGTSSNNTNISNGHDLNKENSIEIFLRHRSELYFDNSDYETALFFAERLLSEKDSLSNRLLVAKCYKELASFNKAYHVLQETLRQRQTEYQRYLTKKSRDKKRDNIARFRQNVGDISFQGIDPLTPIPVNEKQHDISDIGFAFNISTNNNNESKDDDPNNGSFASPFGTGHDDRKNDNDDDDDINKEKVKILLEARYFISLICFELGRYDECEEFLLGKKYSDIIHLELEIPNGVYGIYLMAKVFHKSSRFDLAIEFYQKCLRIDSYHFGAIKALSELGKDPGLTKKSKPTQALQSKHCVIPKNKNGEMIQVEKIDINRYKKLKLLFDNLSWGYFKLQMFHPQDALKYFNNLPLTHKQSAWVLNNTAKCYYEMNDYQRAITNWKMQLDRYPFDLQGMDYYSTALWHLKKSKELTLLSQHCSEIDKTSASTWMVMGNCFSLHKSHDLAIKFFKKAYCIDTNYDYAYTLAGHEYVVNEDFDSALKSFQNAIRINSRHYNAWYGLGNIYQFQQNYKEALYHFKKATEINPNSSVLFVCISNIYKLSSMYKLALENVDRALTLTNATGHHNLKARLEKANIYILMNEYSEAINEFKYLLQIIPNEWKIHFHLGEVYQQIGQKDQALLAFNRAMSLNPKDKNTIKLAIQNVYANNDETSIYHQQQHHHRNSNNHNGNRNRNRNRNRNQRRSNNDNSYQSILIEQDEEEQDIGHYGHHHHHEMVEDVDDDMLDESIDDNDQFMNASGSHDIVSGDRSSINAVGPSHSNSVSPH